MPKFVDDWPIMNARGAHRQMKQEFPPSQRLTKQECFHILEMYKNWNTSQQSPELAFEGRRTEEDDMLDARRQLLIKVHKRLEELV